MTSDSSRTTIAKLAAAASGGLLSLEAAAAALGTSRVATSRRLAALTRSGWLSRVRRGIYSVRPLEASPETRLATEDPWAVAMRVFSPCYIGGWSAAGHWNLTEQIFRSTFVVTERIVRRADSIVGGSNFRVARERPGRQSGLVTVWRDDSRALVSGVARTLLDAAAHPAWVGGGTQLIAVFRAAVDDGRVTSEELLREARGAVTGAALGRLGLLVERYWPEALTVAEFAKKNRGSGNVRFDPGVRSTGSFIRRWGVWMNVSRPEHDA